MVYIYVMAMVIDETYHHFSFTSIHTSFRNLFN